MKVSQSIITMISILIDSMSRKTCGEEFVVCSQMLSQNDTEDTSWYAIILNFDLSLINMTRVMCDGKWWNNWDQSTWPEVWLNVNLTQSLIWGYIWPNVNLIQSLTKCQHDLKPHPGGYIWPNVNLTWSLTKCQPDPRPHLGAVHLSKCRKVIWFFDHTTRFCSCFT